MYVRPKCRLKPFKPLTVLVLVNNLSTTVFACPLCHSDTGKQVRSGIFGADVGFNLLVTMTPRVVAITNP